MHRNQRLQLLYLSLYLQQLVEHQEHPMDEHLIVLNLIEFLFSHHQNQGLQHLIFDLIQALHLGD